MSESIFFSDRSRHARLEIFGTGRGKFLHNLTTNDVKRLAAGKGHESFVTSPQGKTIGFMTVLATDGRLILRTDPDGFSLSLPHFEKYGVFDEIELETTTNQTFEYHLQGSKIEEELRSRGAAMPGPDELDHIATALNSEPVRLIRESLFGPDGWTVLGAIGDAPQVFKILHAFSNPTVDLDTSQVEALRVRYGVPAYGIDITAANLPQEVARDTRAINFVKGCYLGQETVARIDALGHVNKLLRGFLIAGEGDLPNPGWTFEADGKKVGALTSRVSTGHKGRSLALGYLKAALATPGTVVRVVTETGEPTSLSATVSDFPLPESW